MARPGAVWVSLVVEPLGAGFGPIAVATCSGSLDVIVADVLTHKLGLCEEFLDNLWVLSREVSGLVLVVLQIIEERFRNGIYLPSLFSPMHRYMAISEPLGGARSGKDQLIAVITHGL